MRFFFICIIVCLTACNSSSNSFKLDGFVKGAEDSEKMILYYDILKNNEWHEIADTAIITNGKFLFEGNIDELTAAVLVFEYFDVAISARIYLEPTKMKLLINKSQPYAYKLSGTKAEKENIELRKDLESDERIFYEGSKRMDDIFKQIKLNAGDNNLPVVDSLYNLLQYTKEQTVTIRPKMDKTRLDFMLKHNTYRIAPDLLYILAKSKSIPIDTLKYMYDNLPERSRTSLMGKRALKQIEYLEREKDTSEDTTEDALVGSPAPDFSRKDYSGKTIRLSDFKNKKFVLLDFWASWCIPCIKAIPKIKNLQDQYDKKGLVFTSISLDTDSTNWIKAIKKYQLEAWPQILSVEDKNNADDISFIYNVERIPHYILIDKQGKIIAIWGYLGEEQLNIIDRMLKD